VLGTRRLAKEEVARWPTSRGLGRVLVRWRLGAGGRDADGDSVPPRAAGELLCRAVERSPKRPPADRVPVVGDGPIVDGDPLSIVCWRDPSDASPFDSDRNTDGVVHPFDPAFHPFDGTA
jgi:hypothetical protein